MNTTKTDQSHMDSLAQSEQQATASAVARTSHTPGPWRIRNDGSLVVFRPNVGAIDVVAHIALRGQAAANARLIASAPDMLAALKLAEEYSRVAEGDYDEWAVMRNSLEAAIAKAEA